MKYKWFIPILALGIFLATPFMSFAATTSDTPQAVTPAVTSIACANSDYVKIWYNNGHSLKCFAGDGYTGPGLSGVTEVDPGNNCGWVVGYLNGHSYKYVLTSFDTYSIYDNISLYGNPLFNTLTQLDIQGQNCSGTPQSVMSSSHSPSLLNKATEHALTPRTVKPAIVSIACTSSDYLKIWYNNGHSLECFAGNGYTGPGLSGVTEIDPGNNCGWVVGYLNGHSYKNQVNYTFAQYGYPLFNTLTQLAIQGQNCNGAV